jgi:protein SCO1/2
VAASITDGFELWTFEDVRREEAREGRLAAPAVRARTASGEEVELWAPRGDGSAVYLVDFIYTSCPTLCTVLGSEFSQMQSELVASSAPHRPRLLSLSFDVERDGPAELAGYARRHRADPALWTVAAPDTATEERRLLRALGVIAVADGSGGFVHNGAIHVIDGHGVVHGIYDYARWREALRAASQLAARSS